MDETTVKMLGRGRSGIVYRRRDDQGRDIALKVFDGEPIANAVNYVLTGAPNPYIWCEHAIQSACLRRQILTDLVRWWFPKTLRVAPAWGWGWNKDHRAYELQAELISGHHAALDQPFVDSGTDQAFELSHQVMKPLQQHLAESGFDGLVWQAGRGNPVALNNFLAEVDMNTTEAAATSPSRWVWIDLESGVPAVFGLNLIELFCFYLPKSRHHGHLLFDDVDVVKLRRYLDSNATALGDRLGLSQLRVLMNQVDALAQCQGRWKSLHRVERSITYRLKRGHITQDQFDWYINHPTLWYSREAAGGIWRGIKKLSRLLLTSIRWFAVAPYRHYMRNTIAFLSSQRFRAAFARKLVGRRIDRWQDRGQLNHQDADLLRTHLQSEEASEYISDFVIHLATKPAVKLTSYVLMPLLIVSGWLAPLWFFVVAIGLGAVARTLYTGGRCIQATCQGRERPWIALLTGLLPAIGNLAYPLQIIYCGTGRDRQLAQFILYDTFARTGEKLPIWGGQDTLTEHFLNRIPNLIVDQRPKWFVRKLPPLDKEQGGVKPPAHEIPLPVARTSRP